MYQCFSHVQEFFNFFDILIYKIMMKFTVGSPLGVFFNEKKSTFIFDNIFANGK